MNGFDKQGGSDRGGRDFGGRGGDSRGGHDEKRGGRGGGFGRKKVCRFCADKINQVDYKDQNTLKYFVTERGKPFLRAENPRYPKLTPAEELVIQGVMIGLIRKRK